jgi:hypothetical protein
MYFEPQKDKSCKGRYINIVELSYLRPYLSRTVVYSQ